MLLEVFERKPFLSVGVSVELQRAVSAAVCAWRSFYSLPQEVKNRYTIPELNTEWADPGYYDKSKRAIDDIKEYYHYLKCNPDLLFIKGLHHSTTKIPVIQSFFDAASWLHQVVVDRIVSLYELFGYQHEELKEQAELCTLRFLHYVGKPSGATVASSHFDLSCLTFHLFPNNGELEYLQDGEWKKFETSEFTAAVFPGFQAYKATEGRVGMLPHRAVQKQAGDREAIVVFMPLTFAPRFPKGDDQEEWARKHGLGELFVQGFTTKTCEVGPIVI